MDPKRGVRRCSGAFCIPICLDEIVGLSDSCQHKILLAGHRSKLLPMPPTQNLRFSGAYLANGSASGRLLPRVGSHRGVVQLAWLLAELGKQANR